MLELLKKLDSWLTKTEPVTSLSVRLIFFGMLYLLISPFIPPRFIQLVIEAVVCVGVFAAMGSIVVHLLFGPSKHFKPVYNVLWRLTGNEYYLDPFNYTPPVVEKEEEEVVEDVK